MTLHNSNMSLPPEAHSSVYVIDISTPITHTASRLEQAKELQNVSLTY